MVGGNGRVRASLAASLALAAMPALAGTVYRCDSADGARSYSSKRVPGASCVAVSTYKAPGSPSSRRAIRPAAPPVTPAPAAPATVSQATPRRARFVRMGSSTTYSYVDANGVRNYSNTRPKGVANVTVNRVQYPIFEIETCYACAVHPEVNFAKTRLNTVAYKAEIAAAVAAHGVEEAIVRAIIHAESAFRPNALSRAGAQGLMQLMPATARRFGVSDAFDPAQNIRGGVQYLAWLLKRFNGDLTLASAGYNAGEGAVDRHRGVPPYGETQRYVQRVRVLAERYRSGLAAR